MSRIVKSIAVVDDRPNQKKTFAQAVEAELNNMPVIKKQIFSYHENPYADQTLVMPDKQGYIDELNRIKVEISQAKAELRSLGRQIDEAVEARDNPPPAVLTDETESGEDDGPDRIAVAQAEAERLLRETRASIEAMMAGAQAEGDKLAEEAKNNGYLEGFDKGFAQALSEFKSENDPKVQQLDALLEQISNYQEEMVARNEKDLLNLVMTVSQKIVGHEIKNDPRAVVTMLYQVLDQNRREENIRITISSDLMPAAAKASAEVKKLITETAPCAMIYVDEDAEEGTCLVETDKGITDMSVSTQLANMKEILLDE